MTIFAVQKLDEPPLPFFVEKLARVGVKQDLDGPFRLAEAPIEVFRDILGRRAGLLALGEHRFGRLGEVRDLLGPKVTRIVESIINGARALLARQ